MANSLIAETQKKYRESNIPWKVHFELTYRCNLRCCHCYAAAEEKEKELSLGEIKEIIGQLQKIGVLGLVFSGGEPFMRSDIMEILEFAVRNFFIIILSNGTLITPDIAYRLKKIGITQVEISLYGTSQEIHERITQVSDSYSKTIDGVDALSKEKVPVVFKSVMMKQNVHEYLKLRNLAKRYGARFKASPLIIPRRNGSEDPIEFRLEENQLGRMSQWMRDEIKVCLDSQESSQPTHTNMLCNAGKLSCAITPSGIVYPCAVLPWNLGNLHEKTFSDIWWSNPCNELKMLRELTFSDFSQCVKCDIHHVCTPCLAQNYLENHDILQCPAGYCRLAHCLVGGLNPQERR